MTGMSTPASARYTAKLTDGPLEGKTMAVEFLETGDPKPRLEIPAATGGKRYVYTRGAGVEYASEDATSGLPSAVDYRFTESVFD